MKANLELNVRRKESVVVTVSDANGFLRRIQVFSSGFVKCKNYDGKVETINASRRNGEQKRSVRQKKPVNRNIGRRGIN